MATNNENIYLSKQENSLNRNTLELATFERTLFSPSNETLKNENVRDTLQKATKRTNIITEDTGHCSKRAPFIKSLLHMLMS